MSYNLGSQALPHPLNLWKYRSQSHRKTKIARTHLGFDLRFMLTPLQAHRNDSELAPREGLT
jgi:hypothetical protein